MAETCGGVRPSILSSDTTLVAAFRTTEPCARIVRKRGAFVQDFPRPVMYAAPESKGNITVVEPMPVGRLPISKRPGRIRCVAPVALIPSQHTMPEEPVSRSRPASNKASWLQTAWIAVSGLLMIGRNRDFGPDAPKISPARLIIVAVTGAAILIGGLVLLASSIAG